MNINTKLMMNNNVGIPALGLGTYQSKAGKETYDAVLYSLEIGYRHIDTAALYVNESDVGSAVRDSGLPRNDIFITTKLWNSDHGYGSTLKAFETSLSKLKTDYIDLYLIHWPVQHKRSESWQAMLKLFDEGLCKSIGVSNYTIKHIEEMRNYLPVLPAVNQVEFSPYLYQKELLEYCNKNGIIVEAYTPLVRGKKFNDLKLIDLSKKYDKTPAQILIRWVLQRGLVVLPKSVNPLRIAENADVFDFEINENDMLLIDTFHSNYRVCWNPSSIE